ncbi:MAG: hypothetical protein HYX74_00490 [Acidobacteria bacterium]|nr:hypothetical protein [Acidobacteriota bacterium]
MRKIGKRVTRPQFSRAAAPWCVCLLVALLFVDLRGQTVEIPKGTHLKVRLSAEISTKTARKGERFAAVLAEDCTWADRVVIPTGSLLEGSIVRVSRAGRLRGRAELAVHFHQVQLPAGETFEISASPVAAEGEPVSPSREGIVREDPSGKHNTATVVGTTAAGAAVGAAVDGKRGAGIGAGIGVIAGIIRSATGGDKDQILEKGTMLDLVLDRPTRVPLRSAKN